MVMEIAELHDYGTGLIILRGLTVLLYGIIMGLATVTAYTAFAEVKSRKTSKPSLLRQIRQPTLMKMWASVGLLCTGIVLFSILAASVRLEILREDPPFEIRDVVTFIAATFMAFGLGGAVSLTRDTKSGAYHREH